MITGFYFRQSLEFHFKRSYSSIKKHELTFLENNSKHWDLDSHKNYIIRTGRSPTSATAKATRFEYASMDLLQKFGLKYISRSELFESHKFSFKGEFHLPHLNSDSSKYLYSRYSVANPFSLSSRKIQVFNTWVNSSASNQKAHLGWIERLYISFSKSEQNYIDPKSCNLLIFITPSELTNPAIEFICSVSTVPVIYIEGKTGSNMWYPLKGVKRVFGNLLGMAVFKHMLVSSDSIDIGTHDF